MNKINKVSSIKVIGLCGSLREGSYTRMALSVALVGAREIGAETELIDLNEYDLTFLSSKGRRENFPDGVKRLGEKIAQAQGIIIGTPEYHSSFSGVLKNALDWMGFEEFEGKMVGLIGVAGGAMGALNALNSLRMVGRSLHAWVLPNQVSIPQAWKNFNNDGTLNDMEYEERLIQLGEEVTRYSLLLTSEHAQEFIKQWEIAQINPGGN